MQIVLQNKKKISPAKWFNKQLGQLESLRTLFLKDAATSSASALQKRREWLDKAWSAFQCAYVDLVLDMPVEIDTDDLYAEKCRAMEVYQQAKDILTRAHDIISAMDDEVQPLQNPLRQGINFEIEDRLLRLINIPAMTTFSAEHLETMVEVVTQNSRAVEKIFRPTCPMLLCTLVEQKLDDDTYTQWKTHEDRSRPPNVFSLLAFLEQRAANAMCPEVVEVQSPRKVHVDRKPPMRTPREGTERCICCSSRQHTYLGACRMFKRWPLSRRVNLLMHHRLCVNCFWRHHGPCRKPSACFNCGEGHHYLVCYYERAVAFDYAGQYDTKVHWY